MDKICLLPWIHTEFTTEGTAKPCCLYRGEPMGNLKEESFLDIWRGENIKTCDKSFWMVNNQKDVLCVGKMKTLDINLKDYKTTKGFLNIGTGLAI